MSAPDDETLRATLADFATATAKRPPCEAGLDPDACYACIAFTTESLEAGVRLWGQSRAPRTIKALAAEVLRLRAIIEGRTTPPTEAEVEAHMAVGGAWLVTRFGLALSSHVSVGHDEVRRMTTWPDLQWIALDARRRPCPWPEVAL